MGQKLKLDGVRLNHFKVSRKGAGQSVCSVDFEADVTTDIKREMGWDFGEGIPSGDLDGDIIGAGELVPTKHALKDFRISFETMNLSAFAFATVKTKDGSQVKLTFNGKTSEDCMAAHFETWLNAVGEESSWLKIEYKAAKPTQPELPMGDKAQATAVQ